MKVHTVWTGEYSDRCMVAVFLSKEKAERYAEVHDKIDGGFNDYYVQDYDTMDDGFNINTEVHKFYVCNISLRDFKTHDTGEIIEHAGEITTDELWDSFIGDYQFENYDDLLVKNYPESLSSDKLDEIENEYPLHIELKLDDRQSFCEIAYDYKNKPQSVCAYSQLGYGHARKIALDKYYEFRVKQVSDKN